MIVLIPKYAFSIIECAGIATSSKEKNITSRMQTTNESKKNANGTSTFGESSSTKIWHATQKMVQNITVEPVIFFYAIGHSVTTIITQSLYFEKICKVSRYSSCHESDARVP